MPNKEFKNMRESSDWNKSKFEAEKGRWKNREKKLKKQVSSLSDIRSKLKRRTLILSSVILLVLSISVLSFLITPKPKSIDLWFEVNAYAEGDKVILNIESVTDERIILSYGEAFTYLRVVVSTIDDSVITIIGSYLKTADGQMLGYITNMEYDDIVIFIHQGIEIISFELTILRLMQTSA